MIRGVISPGLLAATLLLTACGHSSDTQFFTLDPRGPSVAIGSEAYRGPALRVESVRLPADLDRPELIHRTGPNEMEIDDFSRWAAPLGEMAQRVLTQDLAARLPPDTVIYPGAPAPAQAATLAVDVLDVSIGGGAATMDMSWSLTPAARDDAPASIQAGRALRLSVPISQTGSRGIAEGLSGLMAALADEIAGTLRASVKPVR